MRAAAVAAGLSFGIMMVAGRDRGTLTLAGQNGVTLPTSIAAEIRVGSPVGAVNRLILGNNVVWVDRGDGLLTADGSQFDRATLDLVEDLGATVLRYPGGA